MDWNSYYEQLAETDPPPEIESFHSEFVALVQRQLPDGGEILEAGCGAGWQSRALAECGPFHPTMLDSSEAALGAARRWFDKGGQTGSFVLSDIRDLHEGAFDLVFNVGVLEHYCVDDRVAIVRAMARCSRRFVVVLEPNPLNYWYWIWRHAHTARGTWPFGRETPNTTLPDVLEAAGLRCDETFYLGDEWTNHLVSTILDESTLSGEGVVQVHRSGVIPLEQRAYLVGAIGTVSDSPSPRSNARERAERRYAQEEIAEGLVASLGLATTLQAEVARLRAERPQNATQEPVAESDGLHRRLDDWEQRLAELSSSVENAVRSMSEQPRLSELLRRSQALRSELHGALEGLRESRDELRRSGRAVAALGGLIKTAAAEIALLEERRREALLEAERWRSLASGEHEELKSAEILRSRTAYGVGEYAARLSEALRSFESQRAWKAMLLLRQAYIDLVRDFPRGWISWFRRLATAPARGLRFSPDAQLSWPKLDGYLPAELGEPIVASYRTLDASGTELLAGLSRGGNARLAFPPQKALDILALSIVDSSFRFQRPQQIAAEFARRGSRVFWVRASETLPEGAADAYRANALRDNCWEIELRAPAFDVYFGELDQKQVEAVVGSLSQLIRDATIGDCVVYVQIPFWTPAALRLRELINATVVYDCMDDWDVFPNIGDAVKRSEPRLVREADLTIVSAQRLHEKFKDAARHALIARNACDFDFYQASTAADPLPEISRPIVGFYGALASWVDAELLYELARRRPELEFVLVGQIFDFDVRKLKSAPNVRLKGAQPYELMPAYLRRFDVCLVPFVANQLTDAVDPVKLYEYFTLGKPVVATRTFELQRCERLLYLASGPDEFLSGVDAALEESDDSLRAARVDFARSNSWRARVDDIESRIAACAEPVSILIVTHNSVEYLGGCLESIRRNTFHPNYEVVIVDNHSSDGTGLTAQQYAEADARVKVIALTENRGFAGGNNVAARSASGRFLVLLNADTAVSAGWLARLRRGLEKDDDIGLASAVTNFAGNEIKIDWQYRDCDEMQDFARRLAVSEHARSRDLEMAPLLACICSRELWDEVGGLDEDYGQGMFEDDDFCMQLRRRGRRIVSVEDCFVHHFGQGSFSQLRQQQYDRIFEQNRRRFEDKWGVAWEPHQFRPGVRPVARENRIEPRAFFSSPVFADATRDLPDANISRCDDD